MAVMGGAAPPPHNAGLGGVPESLPWLSAALPEHARAHLLAKQLRRAAPVAVAGCAAAGAVALRARTRRAKRDTQLAVSAAHDARLQAHADALRRCVAGGASGAACRLRACRPGGAARRHTRHQPNEGSQRTRVRRLLPRAAGRVVSRGARTWTVVSGTCRRGARRARRLPLRRRNRRRPRRAPPRRQGTPAGACRSRRR
jgi:hypothetical protein